jgi:hypothetical protein
MKHRTVVLTLLAGIAFVSSTSHANDQDNSVARVSYISGDVSYQRGDVDGWNDLRVNTPLVTGDSFYAPEGGRAEVDLGNGIFVRVDGGTQVNLVNNTSDIAQLGIDSGSLELSARSLPRGFSLEIDTPSGAATLHEPGRYRIDVTDNVATYAVVRGSMSLAFEGQQLDVREGESLELDNGDPPTYGYSRLSGENSFQSWSGERDARYQNSVSARYVNANVVGYQDLDDHGTWRDNGEYGRVWVPTGMSQGWAPYQSGRWIWQDPYGWTWVSNESWGWAPYHYGRWVYAGNAWCWVPPPPIGYRGPTVVMNINAVYAPALVAFVGGSNWGMSLSIGGPAIGWVPLAPAERYYYPWQPAPRVTNNYTNITVINAVTVVNYNTFTTGAVRPVHVDRAQLERAPVMGYTAVGVVPSRGSLVVASAPNQRPAPAPTVRTERPMVTRLVPPPRPEQFTQKLVQIERTGKPVASPVVATPAVGKPFVAGTQAPAGVKAVSALAPAGKKELNQKNGNEGRPPKKIERDIAPPPPSGTVAAPPMAAPTSAPPPAARPEPSPGNSQNPNTKNGKHDPRPQAVEAPQAPASQPTAVAPVPPVAPPESNSQATPGHGQGKPPQAQKNDKNPPPTQPGQAQPTPPASGTPPAAGTAPATPGHGQGKPPQAQKNDKNPPPTQPGQAQPTPPAPGTPPATGTAPVTPPQDAKKKKAKGKPAPETPPTPPEPPPPPPPSGE